VVIYKKNPHLIQRGFMKPLLYMIKGVGIARTSTAPFGDTAGKTGSIEACS